VQRLVDVAAAEIALGSVEWRAGRYVDGARRWNQALARLDAAVQAEPLDNKLLNQWAQQERAVALMYTEAGLWDVTARHLAKVFERPSPNFNAETWRLYACLRLLEGDKKGYRRQCERMIERFGQSSLPHDWHCLATACVLAPEHTGDVRRWVQLQEKFA